MIDGIAYIRHLLIPVEKETTRSEGHREKLRCSDKQEAYIHISESPERSRGNKYKYK